MNTLCEEEKVHTQVVSKVTDNLPDDDTLYEVADLFKIFGDSTRTKIISALFVGELCVCDIVKITNMTISAVSHQLRILRTSSLVKSRKSGKEVFYRLSDEHVKKIYEMAIEHIREK